MNQEQKLLELNDFIAQKMSEGISLMFSDVEVFGLDITEFNFLNDQFDLEWVVESKLSEEVRLLASGSKMLGPEQYVQWINAVRSEDVNLQIAFRIIQESLLAIMYRSRVYVLLERGLVTPLIGKRLWVMFNTYDNFDYAQELMTQAMAGKPLASYQVAPQGPMVEYQPKAGEDLNTIANTLQANWEREFEIAALESQIDEKLLLAMQSVKGKVYLDPRISNEARALVVQELTANDIANVAKTGVNPMLTSIGYFYLRERVYNAWIHKAVCAIQTARYQGNALNDLVAHYQNRQHLQAATDLAKSIGFVVSPGQIFSQNDPAMRSLLMGASEKIKTTEIDRACNRISKRFSLSPEQQALLRTVAVTEEEKKAQNASWLSSRSITSLREGFPLALIWSLSNLPAGRYRYAKELVFSKICRLLASRLESMLSSNQAAAATGVTQARQLVLSILQVCDRSEIAEKRLREANAVTQIEETAPLVPYEDDCHLDSTFQQSLLEWIQRTRIKLTERSYAYEIPQKWTSQILEFGDYQAANMLSNPDFTRLVNECLPQKQHLLMTIYNNSGNQSLIDMTSALVEMHYARIWVAKNLLLAQRAGQNEIIEKLQSMQKNLIAELQKLTLDLMKFDVKF